ncbi:ArsR/SmtB family transcription factor [Corynebacterium uterequi]|uniref:Putative transcriptional regulator n=1 Tax=Corynebacterium uterequi TaxID=1072256 RepID=A0A0G3HI19_9CORY|nr:metalloregulator ArsR/SmtB family transcription factor [Corynebacterium uterequi]AKK11568.1 putative transcriptional regulator [Corynebacterium uterequi]
MVFEEAAHEKVRRASRIISALDSPQRLHIVERLAERDHVVHELVEQLGKSQPLVSQHLRVLKKAGIVEPTRRGREVIYRLVAPEVVTIIDLAAVLGTPDSERGSN